MRRASAILTACIAVAALAAPAADAKVTVGFSKRTLVLQGDDGKNRVSVRCGADGNVRISGGRLKGGPLPCAKVVEVDASMGGGKDKVDFSGVGPAFGDAEFEGFGTGTGTAAQLGNDDDRYIASATAFNLVFGEAGNDRANGGGVRDILVGGTGNDVLNAGAGRDTLLGNAGDDRLSGGAGPDLLAGNAGDDLLTAGPGADALGGGSGMDRLRGGPGQDKLFGGAGKDRLNGGPGKDTEKQDP